MLFIYNHWDIYLMFSLVIIIGVTRMLERLSRKECSLGKSSKDVLKSI